jgi:hypothetical protein
MVYTDKIHMIATTVDELHRFADKIGLHKCYYRNPRKKKHPHYDLITEKIRKKAIKEGAVLVTDREIVMLCRYFYGERIL